MPADRFIFTGAVPDEDLATYYRTASVYMSLSEHEGFCVPLLEAMAADVPVLAYASTAVPDTLGGAGVQFAPKDLEVAAELLGALAYDEALRARVIAGQRRRLADFGDARIRQALAALVAGAVPPSPGKRATTELDREDRIRRSTLRRRDTRRLRVSLPADRRASRHPPRRRGADHLRTRLRHLEERVPGRQRPGEGRHGPTLRGRRARATSTPSTGIPTGSSTTRTRDDDELKWLEMQGPWSPAAEGLPDQAPPLVRRADLLHLSLCADGAGPAGRPGPQHPGADRARRTGDPPAASTRRCSGCRRPSPTTPKSSASS